MELFVTRDGSEFSMWRSGRGVLESALHIVEFQRICILRTKTPLKTYNFNLEYLVRRHMTLKWNTESNIRELRGGNFMKRWYYCRRNRRNILVELRFVRNILWRNKGTNPALP